jgi:hypothetical protein
MRRAAPLAALAFACTAAAAGPEVRLSLESEARGALVMVTPHVESQSARRLRYEVVSSKRGASGRSETRQAGEFDVACCKPVALSRLGFSLGPEEHCRVTVKLFADGKLIAETAAEFP